VAKLLLVEDNEMNRDMLSRRLRKKGYEVAIAVDGKAGVEMASSEEPHLILMDMSLPIMDGWQATQHIKADDATSKIPIIALTAPIMDGWEATRYLKADGATKKIPVIALTAHAMEGDRVKALDAGCDDYDTKPIDLKRLLSKIETLLGTSES